MRRVRRTIAGLALIALTAAPATATNQTASVDAANHASVAAALLADRQEFCMDECKVPPKKLAGSGAFVAR